MAESELTSAISPEITAAIDYINRFPGGSKMEYSYPRIRLILDQGADPNGLPRIGKSFIERLIENIRDMDPEYEKAGYELLKVMLEKGGDPDFKYTFVGGSGRNVTKRTFTNILGYLSDLVDDDNGAVLKRWFTLMRQHGFDFSQPGLVQEIGEYLMDVGNSANRIKAALVFLSQSGAKMEDIEKFIADADIFNAAEKNILQNAVRKNLVMRQGIGAGGTGAGAGGHVAPELTLPPHVKAKIASFLGGRRRNRRSGRRTASAPLSRRGLERRSRRSGASTRRRLK